MSFLEKEIYEQPYVIRGLIETQMKPAQAVAQAIRAFDPAFVMIAARGTSDNAARYAQYLLGIQTGLPVALSTPSIHTLYEKTLRLSKALVIGISQSGRPEDVRQVVTDAKTQGALTLTITNDPDSPLAQSGEYHLHLNCAEEISVAATKTYTAQLTTLAMLTSCLLDSDENYLALKRLPQQIHDTITLSDAIPDWIQRYRYSERIAILGRGYNYCTAFEIGLKIKELCYIPSEEYSEADFRHGPIAVIQRGFPAIVVAPIGKPLPLLIDLLDRLQERGAECLVISNAEDLATRAQYLMGLPDDVPEWLSPICAVIPGQIFAMHLAMTKGHPLDEPQGLQKVTSTR